MPDIWGVGKAGTESAPYAQQRSHSLNLFMGKRKCYFSIKQTHRTRDQNVALSGSSPFVRPLETHSVVCFCYSAAIHFHFTTSYSNPKDLRQEPILTDSRRVRSATRRFESLTDALSSGLVIASEDASIVTTGVSLSRFRHKLLISLLLIVLDRITWPSIGSKRAFVSIENVVV